jgi:hypothetical protein
MLRTKERRPTVRTLRGWRSTCCRRPALSANARSMSWARDRADPHARERAVDLARRDPPAGISADDAVAELRDALGSIGDTCPECPPDEC